MADSPPGCSHVLLGSDLELHVAGVFLGWAAGAGFRLETKGPLRATEPLVSCVPVQTPAQLFINSLCRVDSWASRSASLPSSVSSLPTALPDVDSEFVVLGPRDSHWSKNLCSFGLPTVPSSPSRIIARGRAPPPPPHLRD